MIVDAHTHVFPPMGGPSGFRTTRDHMRFVRWLMFHRSAGRRLDDNSIVVGRDWYKGEDPDDLHFRGGRHGKFLWTAGGVDYSRQYLPPTLAGLASPPELIVAQMDYVGVDKAVIQTGHTYGRLNGYLAATVRRFPDRFGALAMVDEWRIDQPGQIRALDRAIDELGLRGLSFQTGNIQGLGRTEPLDDPGFFPFWDRVREMGIPVFWNITTREPGREAYLAEHAAFGRWLERYPEITSVYTHGIPLYRFQETGKVSLPREVWEPLHAPNLIVEILIPILQGFAWDYPYVEARPIIREYYERLGPDRLAWGSDLPNVERFCTYRQSLDYLRRYCDFIGPADMSKICGGNIQRLFDGRPTPS